MTAWKRWRPSCSTGHSGYDIVVPSDNQLLPPDQGRRARTDRPCQHPELAQSRPHLMQRVAAPTRPMRTARSICSAAPASYRARQDPRAAPDAPLDSWDLLFKPENARRLAAAHRPADSEIDVIPSVSALSRKSPTAPIRRPRRSKKC